MPVYEVTDPASGRIVELTGDSPPTDADLDEIFSSLPPPEKAPTKKEAAARDPLKDYIARKQEPTALDAGAAILSGAIAEPVAGIAGAASMIPVPFLGIQGNSAAE